MLRFTRLVPTFTPLALVASLILAPAAASQGEAPGPPSDTLAVTVEVGNRADLIPIEGIQLPTSATSIARLV